MEKNASSKQNLQYQKNMIPDMTAVFLLCISDESIDSVSVVQKLDS